MGNRAVITTPEREIGLYLHWNGGRDSVEAFLRYCELKDYRSPDSDEYGWARLCQVIGNFFGGGSSVGIGAYSDDGSMDPGDNGIYVIENWKIVDRVGRRGGEQMEYDLVDMLIAIDESMPEKEQIGKDFFTADEVPNDELEVGDMVYVQDLRGNYALKEVVGFGEKLVWSGDKTRFISSMVPYVNRWDKDDWKSNPNNALTEPMYRRVRR